jgi:hypothetical protein
MSPSNNHTGRDTRIYLPGISNAPRKETLFFLENKVKQGNRR